MGGDPDEGESQCGKKCGMEASGDKQKWILNL